MRTYADADAMWLEAIAAVSAGPDPSPSLVFHESRRDETVEGVSGGEPASMRSSWSGLSVARGDRMSYLAAAVPADVAAVARSLAGGRARVPARSSPSAAAGFGPASTVGVDVVGRALATLEAAVPGAAGRARWTSSRQSVHVSSPDGPRAERRAGASLRVAARVRDGRRVGAAVAEAPGEPAGDRAPEEVARRAAGRAARRLEAVPPPRGEREVVFAEGAAGVVLHELVGHAREGDAVASRSTWLTDEVALSEALTVMDDPRRGRIAWEVDDEGTPAVIVPLVREGRAVGALVDRRAAALLGVMPNGHGRRASYRDRVLPRMGCTFAAAGRDLPDDLIDRVADGVLVRRLEAGGTDVVNGTAWFRVLDADRIVRGRAAAPLQPFVLRVDGPRALRAPNVRVADDLRFDGTLGHCMHRGQSLVTSVGAPTIWIGLGGYVV